MANRDDADPARPHSDDFPKPEWPPIQDLESVDITGKRHDGGAELVIVVSQPLDDADETLDSIREKVDLYLEVIDLEEFQRDLEYPPRDKTVIVISSDHPIHPRAMEVINECFLMAAHHGIRLELRRPDASA